jgi:hypothetical protein
MLRSEAIIFLGLNDGYRSASAFRRKSCLLGCLSVKKRKLKSVDLEKI